MEIVLTLLITSAAFVLLFLILFAYTRRVGSFALTDNFQAAESLSNKQVPAKWTREIDRRVARKGFYILSPSTVTGQVLALKKLDQLYRFFEHGRFFDSEETRKELLSRFDSIRLSWSRMNWEEICEQYRGIPQPEEDEAL